MLFNCLFSVLLSLLCCSPTHPFVLNCFVSADSSFVLSTPFNSCQINSHRLVKPSESVVGALSLAFLVVTNTTICAHSIDLVDLLLVLEF